VSSETEHRSAEDVPLNTSEVGEGSRRAVFLHGLMGRGKNFTRIARALADDVRSLLVDLPNHGDSGWTEDFDYPETADIVAAHLRSGFAAEGPVAVVGHSLGGKVAMALALRHPELVSALVVVDISPVPREGSGGEFEHLLGTLSALDLKLLGTRADADDALREPIDDATVRGFLLQNLRRVKDPSSGRSTFAWQPNLDMLYRALPQIGGFPDLGGAQYDGPVLWVAGGDSDYVRDEDADAMRELFPRTTRITIKGAGHWVHSERPEEFIATVRWFLTRDGESAP
jgi:pimeloyl-ACP methyl ester carboxylesterase